MENEVEKKTAESGGTVHSVTGHLRIMQTGNKKLYRVELWLLNDKVNRNGWKYINLESHLNEFLDIPILTAYTNGGRKVGDGHNFRMKVDPETGKEYASFTDADAERIVGWLPQDANIRIEQEDGANWIVGTGYLWRWYSKELVDKITRQGSGMEISIETLVTKNYMDGDVEVEEEYVVLGVTVLGDGVVPAVAGANIQSLATLSAVRSGMRDFVLRAASYENEPQEPQTDKTEKGVKKPMRISKSRLNALANKFEGYTVVGVSEDECKVALLNANNEFYGYSFAESDSGTVIPERIASANASVTFRYNNGEEVEADLDSVIGVMTQRINGLEAEKQTLTDSVNTLSAQIATMQTREKTRRLQAAKDAMNDQFQKINSVRSKADRFDEEIIKALSASVEAGEYTDLEDKDGNWVGDEAVRKEVKVLCADADTEQRAKNRKIIYGERLNSRAEKSEPKTIGELLSGSSDE